MLAEADPLPGSQAEPPLADRHRQRTAQQRRFRVGRHVVGTLARMPVGKTLGRQMVEHPIQIDQHVRVGVFVDRQRGRRVLDEDVEQPDLDVGQFRQGFEDYP